MTMAENIYDRHERLMLEWHGLTVHPTGAQCPLRIIGKHCTANGDRLCVCEKHSRLLDHPRLWRDTRGKYVFTAEPYDFEIKRSAFLDLKADLVPLGIRVSTTPRSPWNHGRTTLIVMAGHR